MPVQAEAKSKRYVGALAPSGTIGFKVVQKRRSKQKRVTGFRFSGVPLTCQEGAKTTRGVVDFPAPLVKGRFKIVALNKITEAGLFIHGNLRAGTLRVSGNVAIDSSGQGTNCDSGVLTWTARRG